MYEKLNPKYEICTLNISIRDTSKLNLFECPEFPFEVSDDFFNDMFNYDSAYRVRYALENGYQYVLPNFEKLRNRYYNEFKHRFTSALYGMVDTAALKKVLQELRHNPGSDSLHAYYSILHCKIVKGTVVAKKFEYDENICYALKTKYIIRVDSVVYGFNDGITRGDSLVAGTPYGYLGGCHEDDPKQFTVGTPELDYALGDTDVFIMSNVGLIDSFYRKGLSGKKGFGRNYRSFCINYFRLYNFLNKDDVIEYLK